MSIFSKLYHKVFTDEVLDKNGWVYVGDKALSKYMYGRRKNKILNMMTKNQLLKEFKTIAHIDKTMSRKTLLSKIKRSIW